MIQPKRIKPIFQAACMMILLTGCLKANEPEPQIDRSLTCVPDKPVNWGEIYSQYTHKSFKESFNEIWTADEHANRDESDWGLHDNIYDKSCKIIRPFWGEPTLGSKSCLPWKIKTYDTIDKVVQWRETGEISNTFEELVGKHWQGEAFDPRVENPFKPEWYNQDADFAVIMRNGHTTWFYPKDCCKFMTFDEMKQEILKHHPDKWQYDDKEAQYKHIYFRKWNAWKIDDNVGITDNERDINLLKYPLNSESPKYDLYEHKNYFKKEEFLMYRAVNHCGHRMNFSIDITR